MLDEKGRCTTLTPDKDFSSTVMKKLCSMKKEAARQRPNTDTRDRFFIDYYKKVILAEKGRGLIILPYRHDCPFYS